MVVSKTLKKTHQASKLPSFSKNWCNCHNDQSKGRLVKCQLKMLGMVQKKTVSNNRSIVTVEQFSLKCSISMFVIRVNLLHP